MSTERYLVRRDSHDVFEGGGDPRPFPEKQGDGPDTSAEGFSVLKRAFKSVTKM